MCSVGANQLETQVEATRLGQQSGGGDALTVVREGSPKRCGFAGSKGTWGESMHGHSEKGGADLETSSWAPSSHL